MLLSPRAHPEHVRQNTNPANDRLEERASTVKPDHDGIRRVARISGGPHDAKIDISILYWNQSIFDVVLRLCRQMNHHSFSDCTRRLLFGLAHTGG